MNEKESLEKNAVPEMVGGGENQRVTQKPLTDFTDKEIIAELKARGYSGRLEYTKVLKL